MLGGNGEEDVSSSSRWARQTYIWCWGKDCSRRDSRSRDQSLKPSRPQILTQILLLYKVFILLAAKPSSHGVERDSPRPPKDLSIPPSGVYLKGFRHAFQNASLECDIPDAPFHVPLMQTVRLEWP